MPTKLNFGLIYRFDEHPSAQNRPKELPSPIRCKPIDEMNVKRVNVNNKSFKLSTSEKKDAITNVDDSDEDISEENCASDQAIVNNKVKSENGEYQKRSNDDDKDKQNAPAAKKQKTENGAIETTSADTSSKAQKKKKNKDRNKNKLVDGKAETLAKTLVPEKPKTEGENKNGKAETLTKTLEPEKPKTEGDNKNVKSKDKDLKLDSDSKEKGIITTLEGVQIEDLTLGSGKIAKPGKKLYVRYIGRLMNGKVFDKNVSGEPFHFTLGKGEVIKGWEIGISGMRIGGERKITVPPQQAYGSAGSPP
ncbi:7794_t:CDS:2, partial [Cetraspora pellucida]